MPLAAIFDCEGPDREGGQIIIGGPSSVSNYTMYLSTE
jgi:hypothetical protein